MFKETPGNGRLNNLNDPNRPQCVKWLQKNLVRELHGTYVVCLTVNTTS